MDEATYIDDEHAVASTEPSAANAVERGIEAGQRIIAESLELLRLEAEERLSRTVRDAALLSLGGVLTLLGWCALMLVVVLVLRDRWSLVGGLTVVGIGHVMIGLAAIYYALSDSRGRERA